MFQTNLVVVSKINNRDGKKKLDYHLHCPNGDAIYLFTKNYVHRCYDMCKGGIRINELLYKKSKDFGVMQLVKQLNRYESYIKYEYELA